MRPAKNERPLATASPDRAEETTDRSVVATRRSKTTVERPEGPLVAPSMRTARVDRVGDGLVRVEPVEAPADAEAAPGLAGLALAGDDPDREVARGLAGSTTGCPVVETRATSTDAVAVVGGVDLADPRVGRPGPGLEGQGQVDLARWWAPSQAVVPQVDRRRRPPRRGRPAARARRGWRRRRCPGPRPASPPAPARSSEPAQANPSRWSTTTRMPMPAEVAEVSDSTSPS